MTSQYSSVWCFCVCLITFVVLSTLCYYLLSKGWLCRHCLEMLADISIIKPCASGLLQRVMKSYNLQEWRKWGGRGKLNRVGFGSSCGSRYWLSKKKKKPGSALIPIFDITLGQMPMAAGHYKSIAADAFGSPLTDIRCTLLVISNISGYFLQWRITCRYIMKHWFPEIYWQI